MFRIYNSNKINYMKKKNLNKNKHLINKIKIKRKIINKEMFRNKINNQISIYNNKIYKNQNKLRKNKLFI